MNTAVKLIGKGLGSIALAIFASFFAVYALKHFPGWAIALSFVLLVCASIPMVLFFNLFPSADATPIKSYVIEDDPHSDWNDLFGHRRDDDDRFDD